MVTPKFIEAQLLLDLTVKGVKLTELDAPDFEMRESPDCSHYHLYALSNLYSMQQGERESVIFMLHDQSSRDIFLLVAPRRNRALTNFSDLCLIYAYTTADGRFSLSSHDIDFDDDIKGAHPDACSYRRKKLLNYEELGLIYGNAIIDDGHMHRDKNFEKGNLQIKIGGEDTQCHPDDDYSKTYWTPSSDRYFIDLMLEEVHRGSKIDTSFNIQAWIDMALLVRERFGLPHDKDLLRSRHKHFRNLYYDMKNLLYQRGSSWDETRQLIAAYDDVCDAYFKEHPDAIKYRDRNMAVYNDLCAIYDDTTPFKRSSCPDLESEIDNNALDVGINDIFQDLQDLVAEFEIPDCRKKRKSATSSTSACSTKSQRCNKRVLRRTRNSNPHVGKLLVPKEEGKDFTSIVTPELGANPHMVKLLVAKEEGKDYIPIETIVDALQVLPGMNDELFLEACKLLENEKKIKMFVAMDVNQRTKWLLKKLQRQLH
ncbi:hypothetical protein HS088_TW12G00693 [Tripterygium wilfordii]|uniref:Myb/SANT-like domain-containing protein n=1 Tax=Tripterygium wilfordii TaxID=458696 RepID=A0A7J7CZH3_TRIWF|nr:hypothetical protein HS088_TW12G00693 [Tripterygium wilfordii]